MRLGSIDTNAMTLQGEPLHRKLYVFFCVLVVVTMPLSIPANSVCIMLLALNWLVEGQWKLKAQRLFASKYALLWVLFFAYHALSILYSDNKHEAKFELEKKLSFFVFPVIFATSDFADGKTARTILKYFICSCVLACIICLSTAFYYYLNGNPSLFFYHGLGSALDFHAVYFSTFIGFCIFAILYHLMQNQRRMVRAHKVMFISLIAFFFIFLILLSSKTISVTVFFIALAMGIFRFLKRYNKIVVCGAAVLALVVFGVIIQRTSYLNDRFREIFKENYKEVLNRKDYRDFHFTGGTIRLAIWKSVFELAKEKNAMVFGLGIGDAQTELTGYYDRIHIYPGDDSIGTKGFTHYNAHNQYLQFYLTLGILGAVWFIVILVYCYRQAIRSRHVLLLSLLILFTAFFFTESALCAHKGVVFFMFFTSLFVLQKRQNSN
jgi:O-antigen ligase